mmetsp:Transcript_21063/g.25358  ORF Transcript_21063/g.25358 Transcript_21063/m.25358 type:complete len:290 (+) Transcript_21063:64-933(+)
MLDIVETLSAYLDSVTGIEGVLGYLLIVVVVMIGHNFLNKTSEEPNGATQQQEEEEEPDPPRNFTSEQLKYFDGKKDEKTEEVKPVYLSLHGTVFDVSNGRNFYGPDGPYECFAGHECGVALAKMSFDTEFLDDMDGCETLNFGEKSELEGWIEKFTHYRCYPIMGRLIPDKKLPSSERILSKEELAEFDGTGEVPEGYATAPIYVGAGEKVFDCSFGGVTFYGPNCAYNRFAGKNASRALAKMSFDPEDTENTNIDDLPDKQKKVLQDWVKTFEERKGYPIVGRLEKN